MKTAEPAFSVKSGAGGAPSDKFADQIVDKDGNLKKPKIEAFFRSMNQYFEWNEDDSGNRVDVAVPKDDVVEGLKRRDQNAAAGD